MRGIIGLHDYINIFDLPFTNLLPLSQVSCPPPYFCFSNDAHIPILPLQISSFLFLQQFTRTVSETNKFRVGLTLMTYRQPTRGWPLDRNPNHLQYKSHLFIGTKPFRLARTNHKLSEIIYLHQQFIPPLSLILSLFPLLLTPLT